MSRSYKKFPGCSNEFQSKKFGKRIVSRRVRHYRWFDEISNGGWYKKLAGRFDVKPFFYTRFHSDKEVWGYIDRQSSKGGSWVSEGMINNNKFIFRCYYLFKSK
jgi:hypothetical protein